MTDVAGQIGLINELETPHSYIERLNEEAKLQEAASHAALAEMERRVAELARRVAEIAPLGAASRGIGGVGGRWAGRNKLSATSERAIPGGPLYSIPVRDPALPARLIHYQRLAGRLIRSGIILAFDSIGSTIPTFSRPSGNLPLITLSWSRGAKKLR